MRTWVSTRVSTCGWNTRLTPYCSQRRLASSSVPVTRFLHSSRSRSPGCTAEPVCRSVYCSGADQILRTHCGEQLRLAREVLNSFVQRVLSAVQAREDRPTADSEIALCKLVLELLRILRKVALRAELGVPIARPSDRRSTRPSSPGADRWRTRHPTSLAQCRVGASKDRSSRRLRNDLLLLEERIERAARRHAVLVHDDLLGVLREVDAAIPVGQVRTAAVDHHTREDHDRAGGQSIVMPGSEPK